MRNGRGAPELGSGPPLSSALVSGGSPRSRPISSAATSLTASSSARRSLVSPASSLASPSSRRRASSWRQASATCTASSPRHARPSRSICAACTSLRRTQVAAERAAWLRSRIEELDRLIAQQVATADWHLGKSAGCASASAPSDNCGGLLAEMSRASCAATRSASPTRFGITARQNCMGLARGEDIQLGGAPVVARWLRRSLTARCRHCQTWWSAKGLAPQSRQLPLTVPAPANER